MVVYTAQNEQVTLNMANTVHPKFNENRAHWWNINGTIDGKKVFAKANGTTGLKTWIFWHGNYYWFFDDTIDDFEFFTERRQD